MAFFTWCNVFKIHSCGNTHQPFFFFSTCAHTYTDICVDGCGHYEAYTPVTPAHPSMLTHTLLALSGSPAPAHPRSCSHSPPPFLSGGPRTSVREESIADLPAVLGALVGTSGQADSVLGPGWQAPLCAVQLQGCSGMTPVGSRAEAALSAGQGVPASPPAPFHIPFPGRRVLAREQAQSQENREQSPSSQSRQRKPRFLSLASAKHFTLPRSPGRQVLAIVPFYR